MGGGLIDTEGGNVNLGGGDIEEVDDIVCNGSGSNINVNEGHLSNVAYANFVDTEPGTTSSGETTAATLSGLWRLKTSVGHIHEYGVYAYEGPDASVGDFTLDINDIDGVSFGNGVFLVTSTMLISPNPTGTNLAYAEKREWFLYKNFGSGAWNATECHSCQAWNPDSYMAGSFSISGSTLTITKNAWAHTAETTWFVTLTARTVS
jgi:hypothetical protein